MTSESLGGHIKRGSIEERDNGEEEEKAPKIESSLDFEDLGAGYSTEDKRVARAIQFYESKLLPFIHDNSSIFKKSNFLAIKGYGTKIRKTNSRSRRSSQEGDLPDAGRSSHSNKRIHKL